MHDLIISAGQNLLKKETIIEGFQHPCLGQRCAFNVQNGDFIQVLNNASCHWLTISTIGASCGEVFVYDSLYSGAGSSLKDHISSILHTNGKEKYPHVQQQSGSCDCGLFALEFATCLVNGIKPETQVFEQDLMRQHLHKCFQDGKLRLLKEINRLKSTTWQWTLFRFTASAGCQKMVV